MIRGIDHLVIISFGLEKAIDGATQAGFTVIAGGRHKHGATHNALIVSADGCYIELIAPTDGIRGKSHRWFPRLAKGGGLVDFCLRSDGLEADVAAMRARGRHYAAPVENGRRRPDGVELRWKSATPSAAAAERGWSFLIEDVTTHEDRVSGDPAHTTHANGSAGVAAVIILTRDLTAAIGDFEAITGRPARTVNPRPDDASAAAIIDLDHCFLMLAHPCTEAGMQHLNAFGAGPYAVTLHTRDASGISGGGRSIPPALLSGARFELAARRAPID